MKSIPEINYLIQSYKELSKHTSNPLDMTAAISSLEWVLGNRETPINLLSNNELKSYKMRRAY